MKHNLTILKAARALELTVAAIILVVIVWSGALLLWNTGNTLLLTPDAFSLGDFFSSALLLVMGLEFVKMLALHSAGAVIDVLLFTIVRQMIISHSGALDTLLGVAAVAAIFAVKKFLHSPETDES
jgi:hypothetical protein